MRSSGRRRSCLSDLTVKLEAPSTSWAADGQADLAGDDRSDDYHRGSREWRILLGGYL